MEKIPGSPSPSPSSIHAGSIGQGHETTVQQAHTLGMEQNTDTIHDQVSLAGTSLPSLTGSKQHDIPMATTKPEYSLR